MTAASSLDDRIARALFLRQQSLLRGLPAAALFTLEGSAVEAGLAVGERLPTGGEQHDTLVAVVEGSLAADRGARPPRVIEAGELAGLTHLLAGRPPLELRAREAARVLLISEGELDDLIEHHFATVQVMVRHLARECLADIVELPDEAELGGPAREPLERRLDFVERLGVLAHSETFPAQGLDALSELSKHVEERRWEPGTTLWRAGDPADEFLLVVDGAVRCDTGSGRHRHSGRGATVGEYEALGGDFRSFTAVTAAPLTALRVDRDLFFDVLEDHAGMARGFLQVLAQRRLELAGRRPSAPAP